MRFAESCRDPILEPSVSLIDSQALQTAPDTSTVEDKRHVGPEKDCRNPWHSSSNVALHLPGNRNNGHAGEAERARLAKVSSADKLQKLPKEGKVVLENALINSSIT